MSKALFMNDCYLKEWDAEVISVSKDKFIVLNQTGFYPNGGGVEWDTGFMTRQDGKRFTVVYTGKFSGNISHEVNEKGLKKRDYVHCQLDWKRRYLLMRYHTATHVLSGVFFKEYGLKVTGNQLTTQKGRLDLDMEEMDVDLIQNAIMQSNEIIQQNLPVEIYYLSHEEAKKDTDLFKLAMDFPHNLKSYRIVDIKGFDRQADGGCHVRTLNEIGRIHFKESISKGRHNKRVYFTVE